MKLIIISNRLPLKVINEDDQYKITPSQGGLATGLDSLETGMNKHWIGWPGLHIEDERSKKEITEQLEQHNFHPVYLSPEQIEHYYEGYSNSTLWPLCHYFYNYVTHENKYWDAYQEVNSLFCNSVTDITEPGDILWVQDYQLMLLPSLIREKIPDVHIGYFHHIPFPSYELFRNLPERSEILHGLLGADLIAFHTYSYMRHFISAVYRVLKLDCDMDEIQLDSRIVNVNAFPMGIHYEKYYDASLNPEINKKEEELKECYGHGKIILSVDRLDYSKGILLRLQSFSNFLKNHPEYKGKVSLIMIVSPSRDNVDTYADLKDEIDKMVGAINGTYSAIDWTPVHYFYRSFDFEELASLYHIADIALVTPVRDGMNLVAKEFLATKRNRPGVLILSEMAGASIELSDALVVNPSNTEEIEEAILKALTMPVREQRRSLKNMQKIISEQTVQQWAQDFIKELKSVRIQNDDLRKKILDDTSFQYIKEKYNKTKKRLFILDYDGTLVGFNKDPRHTSPSDELISVLEKLTRDPKNTVVISSGRDRKTLEKWLGHLPVGLTAEHGAFYRERGTWFENIRPVKWNKEILETLNRISRKTPNSLVEIKKTAIVFHYRNVDPWLADLRVNELVNALINPCSRNNLQIMKGNKIVEIKPPHFSKGSDAQRLLHQRKYDFILAMGDDTTDEEMFLSLPRNALTIKVGRNSRSAKYNIPFQNGVLPFFRNLTDNISSQKLHLFQNK